MSATNFSALTANQKKVWAKLLWTAARDDTFAKRFMGDENAPIHRITELTKTERGDRAIISLVADLEEDGVTGDNQREGNEESMQSYEVEIGIDQISHSVRNKGKLSDQKSVVQFRETGLSKLKIWLSDRIDQMFFLTLAGVSYSLMPDGKPRSARSSFPSLSFAADVRPPSPKRSLMWDGNAMHQSDTSSIDTSFKPSYRMLVDAHAYAKEHHVKPIRSGGKDHYIVLMHPQAMALLKKDPEYREAIVHGMERNKENPVFTGGVPTVDGLVIYDHHKVFNTKGAADGSKWGAGGHVNGSRTMLMGSQALAHIDLTMPTWTEKGFDYDNQQGINVDKMIGWLKPKFYSIADGSVEDFGCLAIDHYVQ